MPRKQHEKVKTIYTSVNNSNESQHSQSEEKAVVQDRHSSAKQKQTMEETPNFDSNAKRNSTDLSHLQKPIEKTVNQVETAESRQKLPTLAHTRGYMYKGKII